MTHLDEAHAALMRAVAAGAPVASCRLGREQAVALLDEAARLVAERDRARRERDEWQDLLVEQRLLSRRWEGTAWSMMLLAVGALVAIVLLLRTG